MFLNCFEQSGDENLLLNEKFIFFNESHVTSFEELGGGGRNRKKPEQAEATDEEAATADTDREQADRDLDDSEKNEKAKKVKDIEMGARRQVKRLEKDVFDGEGLRSSKEYNTVSEFLSENIDKLHQFLSAHKLYTGDYRQWNKDWVEYLGVSNEARLPGEQMKYAAALQVYLMDYFKDEKKKDVFQVTNKKVSRFIYLDGKLGGYTMSVLVEYWNTNRDKKKYVSLKHTKIGGKRYPENSSNWKQYQEDLSYLTEQLTGRKPKVVASRSEDPLEEIPLEPIKVAKNPEAAEESETETILNSPYQIANAFLEPIIEKDQEKINARIKDYEETFNFYNEESNAEEDPGGFWNSIANTPGGGSVTMPFYAWRAYTTAYREWEKADEAKVATDSVKMKKANDAKDRLNKALETLGSAINNNKLNEAYLYKVGRERYMATIAELRDKAPIKGRDGNDVDLSNPKYRYIRGGYVRLGPNTISTQHLDRYFQDDITKPFDSITQVSEALTEDKKLKKQWENWIEGVDENEVLESVNGLIHLKNLNRFIAGRRKAESDFRAFLSEHRGIIRKRAESGDFSRYEISESTEKPDKGPDREPDLTS